MANIALKIFVIVILTIVVLILLLRLVTSNLQFAFDFDNVSINNLQSGTLNVDIKIQNDNIFNINVSDLTVKLFYKGKLVLITSKGLDKFTVRAHNTTKIKTTSIVLINNNTINLLLEALNNKSEITYEASFRTFGIPTSDKDTIKDFSL